MHDLSVFLMKPHWVLAALLMGMHTQVGAQDTTSLSLDEAVQIALVRNYALQGSRLDVAEGRQALRERTAVLYPQVDGQSRYARNIREANPFAGSAAGDVFAGFAFLGWLQYNEQARTDDDPTTIPITFTEYTERQRRGLDAASIVVEPSDNPFAIANQYINILTIRQTLMDLPNYRRLFGPAGARSQVAALEQAANRQEQLIIGDVRRAFYDVLLAQEEARVAMQSVVRTRTARDETAQRVEQGLLPGVQRLGMEVELANRETARLRAHNRVEDAMASLKYVLGMPVLQPLRLRGALVMEEVSPYLTLAPGDAIARAERARPDLNQATLTARSADNEARAMQLTRLPVVELFANVGYFGRVPDHRTVAIEDPDEPFRYTRVRHDYFSKAYWKSSVSVGFSLSWSLISGFQRRARVEIARIAANRAALHVRQVKESIRMEVESALRTLAAAHQQIVSQQVNVTNAELNYEYLYSRFNDGLAGSMELLTASAQLDTSRLNHLQAVHSYLIAQSTVEIALGLPLSTP